MTRNIYCQKCGTLKPMHPEDVAMGFKRRRTVLRVKKPSDHAIIIDGVKQPQMASIFCDGCGVAVPDGEEVVAVTMWRTDQEGEPLMWEHDYEM